MVDEEMVDIRRYWAALARNWPALVLLTVVGLVVGGYLARTSRTMYEASAGVVVVQTRTMLQLGKEADVAVGSQPAPANLDVFRQTLAGLVRNPVIAQRVANRAATLPLNVRDPNALLEMIDVDVTKGAGLIEIVARGPDPSVLPQLANLWAEEFVAYVNQLYSSLPSQELLDQQVQAARDRYQAAQTELERFIGQSRVDALTQQIEARKKLIAATYETRLKVHLLLADARSLRQQLRDGGDLDAIRERFALLLLEMQAFASSAQLPANVQIQMSGSGPTAVSATDLAKSLDALVAALEQRERELDAMLGPAGAALAATGTVSPTVSADTQFDPELRQLQQALAAEQARQAELTRQRDLARDAYTALARKAEETKINAGLPNSQVALGRPASVQQVKAGPGPLVLLVAPAVALVGVGVVLLIALEIVAPGVTLPLPRRRATAAHPAEPVTR